MNLKKIVGKKILITGGAGFIGSNLCEFFLNLGAIVICMDNLATGKMTNINPFNQPAVEEIKTITKNILS